MVFNGIAGNNRALDNVVYTSEVFKQDGLLVVQLFLYHSLFCKIFEHNNMVDEVGRMVTKLTLCLLIT